MFICSAEFCNWLFAKSAATKLLFMLLTCALVEAKFSHTRYRALGPELIPVYRQSARR